MEDNGKRDPLRTFRFEHDGKVWELPRPNQITKYAYKRHLARQRLQGIQAARDLMDGTAFGAAMDSWGRGFNVGHYRWLGTFFYETTADPENVFELILIWFLQADPKADSESMRRTLQGIWKTRHDDLQKLLGEMLRDSDPFELFDSLGVKN